VEKVISAHPESGVFHKNTTLSNWAIKLARLNNWKTVTKKKLAVVVNKLNNRSRKRLNYQTPSEVFLKNTTGALTG
jgi:IS30 family transposase